MLVTARRVVLGALLALALVAPAKAQITVPNTLVDGTVISAAGLNTNFSTIANHALDRLSGGNLAGNVTADVGITFDGVDVGVQACVTCTPTHAKLTLSDTTATSLTVAGGLTIGTGVVALVNTAGKIPAISSTFFASLSGTNLTGVALLGSANTFTARNDFLTYTETFTSPAISTNVLTLDLTTATHFYVTLNANVTTLTLSNPPAAGRAGAFTLAFIADGTARTVTWPASVKWPSGTAPTLTGTNTKIDVIQCVTYTQGTQWLCGIAGQNF